MISKKDQINDYITMLKEIATQQKLWFDQADLLSNAVKMYNNDQLVEAIKKPRFFN